MPDVLYSRKGDGMERGLRVGRWRERHCKVGFFISSIFWNLQIHGLLIDHAYSFLAGWRRRGGWTQLALAGEVLPPGETQILVDEVFTHCFVRFNHYFSHHCDVTLDDHTLAALCNTFC